MGVKFDVDYTNPQIPTFSHEFEFNVALRPQRPYGPLGTGTRGPTPRLHTAPVLCVHSLSGSS